MTARRRGATLMEMVIAMTVASVALVVCWEAIRIMARYQASADTRSHEAIERSRMIEVLLRDLRSAKEVSGDSEAGYEILRWDLVGGTLGEVLVTWTVETDPATEKLQFRRSPQGGREAVYSHSAFIDQDYLATQIRINRSPDVVFVP